MSELLCSWYESAGNVDALKAMGLSDQEIADKAVFIVRPVLSSFVIGDVCYVVVDHCGGVLFNAAAVNLSFEPSSMRTQ